MSDYKFVTDIYRHKVTLVELNGQGKIVEVKKYNSIHEASEDTGNDKDFILNCCIYYESETQNNFSKIKNGDFKKIFL